MYYDWLIGNPDNLIEFFENEIQNKFLHGAKLIEANKRLEQAKKDKIAPEQLTLGQALSFYRGCGLYKNKCADHDCKNCNLSQEV